MSCFCLSPSSIDFVIFYVSDGMLSHTYVDQQIVATCTYELPPSPHTHTADHNIGGTTRTPLTLITIVNQKYSVPYQNLGYARLMAPPTTSGGA